MGSTRLQARKANDDGMQVVQPAPVTKGEPGQSNIFSRSRKRAMEQRERQAQEQAAAAALSAAEKAAAQKTAELANSAGGGITIDTNGQGSTSYTEGNPGQDDSQSQGDVDLSTSDTTLRRRGGYRRDAGIRI